ncbi:hypothetical protein JCM14469_42790 [Desulfatiferula olefinivorans]
MNRLKPIVIIVCVLLLSGCVTLSPRKAGPEKPPAAYYPPVMEVQPTDKHVFVENFTDNSRNWPLDGQRTLENGRYRIKNSGQATVIEPVDVDWTGDWTVSATLEPLGKSGGVYLRIGSAQKGCLDCGEAKLSVYPAGNLRYDVVDRRDRRKHEYMKDVDGVNPRAANTLSISRKAGTISFAVNGKPIASVPGQCFKGDVSVGTTWDHDGMAVYNLAVVQSKSLGLAHSGCLGFILEKNRQECMQGEKNGPHRVSGDLVYDTRYNLMWMKETRHSWYWKSKIRLPDLTYDRALDWKNEINNKQFKGVSTWRLPTFSEYHDSFDSLKRVGIDGKQIPVPKHPTSSFVVYRDNGGKVSSISRALLVCDGPFDYLMTLKGLSQMTVPDNPDAEAGIQTVIKAFKAGLTDIGDMEMKRLIRSHARYLYDTRAWTWMYAEKIPLRYYGLVLHGLYDSKKDDPAYWVEFAQVALLAGRPNLALFGMDRAEPLFDSSRVWKDREKRFPYLASSHITEMLQVIRALAQAEIAWQTESREPLKEAQKLMFGPEWTGNPYLLPYLNAFGLRLFRDRCLETELKNKYGQNVLRQGPETLYYEPIRKQWAIILGYDADLLPGLETMIYTRLNEQDFVHPETGDSVAAMGKDSKIQAAPVERKPMKPAQGRVLD